MKLRKRNLVRFSVSFFVNYSLHIVAEAYRMNRRMTEDPMANYVDVEL